MKRRSIVRKICAVTAFAGFLFMIGAAGAIECNHIDFTSGVVKMLIGLLLFAASTYVGGFLEWQ